jgi:uncharacterized membrane protein
MNPMKWLVAIIGIGGAASSTFAALSWLTVEGADGTFARDISSDGSVVVGEVRFDNIYLPYMWENGIPTRLPGVIYGVARAVSPDGRFITGGGARVTGGADNNAARWDRTGTGQFTYNNLGSYSNTVSGNYGHAVSDTGRTVGRQNQPGSIPSIAWIHEDATGFRLPPEGYNSSRPLSLSDISADGTIYVGRYENDAAIWVNGVRSVLPVRVGASSAAAISVSTDGVFVVGRRRLGSFDSEAFLYGPSGLTVIGRLPGHREAVALGVSDDGSIVVGNSDSSAFVWTQSTGMVDLNVMLADAGFEMTGIKLFSAEGISADGRFITGSGFRDGPGTAYIIDLPAVPEPGCAVAGAVGAILLCRRRRGRSDVHISQAN